MNATGVVRRIDDLGRIVIPREVRQNMNIREGDPLEIFTTRDGEIILKKYAPSINWDGIVKDFESLDSADRREILTKFISVMG